MHRFIHQFAIVLAAWTLLLIVQLVRGAAARQKALGTIRHICGSGIVSGLVRWFAVRILLHYAGRPASRKSVLALRGIAFVRVFPGTAAFMSRIARFDAPRPMPIMILSPVLNAAIAA
jgi:hypothetical protein